MTCRYCSETNPEHLTTSPEYGTYCTPWCTTEGIA